MTIAVTKTKAEQTLSEAFDGLADRLPGSSDVRAARKAAIERFATLGLPHRRIEEWKYTDLRNHLKESFAVTPANDSDITIDDVTAALGPLAGIDAHTLTFVDGYYHPELSTSAGLKGVDVRSVADALCNDKTLSDSGLIATSGSEDCNSIFALNTAYMSDGAMVHIDDGAELSKPILIVHVRAAVKPGLNTVRNVLRVGAKAHATVIEAYVTLPGAAPSGQINAATEVIVADDSRLTHVTIVVGTGQIMHLANGVVELGARGVYQGFQFTQDVGLARNNIRLTFKGEDASVDLSGVFLARAREHIDTTFVVDHAVPGCQSRELFKGVLDGQARGINQGKVIVRPDAQKTDGKQMAQALMLSADAEFDSKPELEIYADDVACGHGSTSAELDPDLMFYCGSRGIPESEARALLIQSFVGEAIDKVAQAEIAAALGTLATDWLKKAHA